MGLAGVFAVPSGCPWAFNSASMGHNHHRLSSCRHALGRGSGSLRGGGSGRTSRWGTRTMTDPVVLSEMYTETDAIITGWESPNAEITSGDLDARRVRRQQGRRGHANERLARTLAGEVRDGDAENGDRDADDHQQDDGGDDTDHEAAAEIFENVHP